MIPKLFVYCKKFNNGCEKTEEIQNLFATSIEIRELNGGSDIGEKFPVITKVITDVAKKYCSDCTNFDSAVNE
ncbi:MAG TPA: hypothetical protein PLK94_01580 [Alphaproteobacteria bacterium]|nr:hypothetical protein [Alphaproteobacteria bacterium]HPQ42896.1 hypothetical protein [Syntrophales bacterium]